MKSILWTAVAALALTLCPSAVNASGPIAVYALVDKVTFEPNAERIRISGAFITGDGNSGDYSAPQRGYLYFGLPGRGQDELAQREWTDLASVAGTRQVVGIGEIWRTKVRVRKPDEQAESSDDYPMGHGLIKINSDEPRAKALLDFKER